MTRTNAQAVSSREIVLRFCLVALAVIVCYQFEWRWLRSLTMESQMRLDALLGMAHQRIASDTILWNGRVYQYVIACTFVDVWFGAIPLMWNLKRSVSSNMGRIIALAVVLFVFNVSRLSFSNVLFDVGVPWELAHNVVGGFSYFAVWVWLWNHSGWKGHAQDDKACWNVEPEPSAVR